MSVPESFDTSSRIRDSLVPEDCDAAAGDVIRTHVQGFNGGLLARAFAAPWKLYADDYLAHFQSVLLHE